MKMCSPTAEGREYTLPLYADGGLTVPSQVSNGGVDYAVVEIEYGTFYQDPSIVSVKLPASLKEVSTGIFCWCENLQFVDLSEVTDLYLSWFSMVDTPSLRVLKLPTTLKYKVIFSFHGEYNLEKLYLPQNYLNGADFIYSLPHIQSVKEVYSPSAIPPNFRDGGAIDACSVEDLNEFELTWFGNWPIWENQPVIYVPIGAADAYRNSESWHIYNDIREMDFASVDAVTEDSAADRLTFSGGSIIAPDGEAVTVYDLSGRMVANSDLAQGIYIVRVGDRCVKFAVRR